MNNHKQHHPTDSSDILYANISCEVRKQRLLVLIDVCGSADDLQKLPCYSLSDLQQRWGVGVVLLVTVKVTAGDLGVRSSWRVRMVCMV